MDKLTVTFTWTNAVQVTLQCPHPIIWPHWQQLPHAAIFSRDPKTDEEHKWVEMVREHMSKAPIATVTTNHEITANDKQIGGNHYKKQTIQPWDFIHQNNIGFLAGNVIKYVARYKDKNGIEDLEKARHYLDKLIEEENNGR